MGQKNSKTTSVIASVSEYASEYGTKKIDAASILNWPTGNYLSFGDIPDHLWAVGEFKNGYLTGEGAIYYDADKTMKFMVGKFTVGMLTFGTIYSNDQNNTIIEHGTFDLTCMDGVILRRVELFEPRYLYLKVTDMNNRFDNKSNINEYYFDVNARNLAVKCDESIFIDRSGDGKHQSSMDGDVLYYNKDRLFFEGKVLKNKPIYGLIYHKGLYVEAHIHNNMLNGDAVLYDDYDKKNKIGTVFMKDGVYEGVYTCYKNNVATGTIMYENGVVKTNFNDLYERWTTHYLSINSDNKSSDNKSVDNKSTDNKNYNSLESLDYKFKKTMRVEFTQFCKACVFCGLITQEYMSEILNSLPDIVDDQKQLTFNEWLDDALQNRPEWISDQIGNDLFITMKKSCADDRNLADYIEKRLLHPTKSDKKNKRLSIMRDAYENLLSSYELLE